MSKYHALEQYLQSHPASTSSVTLGFPHIEKILGFPLPPSARRHQPWWANDTHHSHAVWLGAGWETRDVDTASERVTFVRTELPKPERAPYAIPSRPALTTKRRRTSDRMERRVNDLIAGFDQYVQAFNDGNPFTGPSIYFHHKTLAILQQHSTPCSALHSDEFLDYLYATLASWGMHRMGPGGAKLADISQIKDSFVHQEASIREVQSLSLCTIPSAHVSHVTSTVWDILDSLRVGTSGTKLVANSKALHHLLPALVPPIDRAYTLRFFYDNTTLSKGDEATFKEIYPYFHRIAVTRREQITSHLGTGMNTSETKVIDNAIVGFVRTHLVERRQRRSADPERN